MNLLKVPSLSGMAKDIGTSASSATRISLMICGAALALALIGVLYKLANGEHHSKEALIGWFAAVIVYGIAVTYILNN